MAVTNFSTSSISTGVKRKRFWDQITFDGNFESIATTTVGSTSVADITFSSIPATYTHLQIRGIARSNDANNYAQGLRLQFNSDTATNYSRHVIDGDGSSILAAGSANLAHCTGGLVTGANQTASVFCSSIIDILDYANTNKYKTIRAISGNDVNSTSGGVVFNSSNWRSTNAITSIKLFSAAGNLVQYSSFALYGVKA